MGTIISPVQKNIVGGAKQKQSVLFLVTEWNEDSIAKNVTEQQALCDNHTNDYFLFINFIYIVLLV